MTALCLSPCMTFHFSDGEVMLWTLKRHHLVANEPSWIYCGEHYGVPNQQPHNIFTQLFIQAQIKKTIKAPRHWFLCGEFTGDRWIPRLNGQQRGKLFHSMASSCLEEYIQFRLTFIWHLTVSLLRVTRGRWLLYLINIERCVPGAPGSEGRALNILRASWPYALSLGVTTHQILQTRTQSYILRSYLRSANDRWFANMCYLDHGDMDEILQTAYSDAFLERLHLYSLNRAIG